jgi:mRNA-degrading endonuclease RelE of RelBE toxin-antitoxin system
VCSVRRAGGLLSTSMRCAGVGEKDKNKQRARVGDKRLLYKTTKVQNSFLTRGQ